MKPKALLFCVTFLVAGISAAQAAPSFLKVGSWYSLTASPGTPLLSTASTNPTDVSSLNIKVVELGSGDWCLVEYDYFDNPRGIPTTVEKRREWLNFAFVANVVPASQPDYQKLFPGIKVVSYKGTSK